MQKLACNRRSLCIARGRFLGIKIQFANAVDALRYTAAAESLVWVLTAVCAITALKRLPAAAAAASKLYNRQRLVCRPSSSCESCHRRDNTLMR